MYKKRCDPLTNKTIADPANPDMYIRCDGYRNPHMSDWISDDDQIFGMVKALGYTVIGAYLTPDTTK